MAMLIGGFGASQSLLLTEMIAGDGDEAIFFLIRRY